MFKNRGGRTSGVIDGLRSDIKVLVDGKIISEKENQILLQTLQIIEETDKLGDYSNFLPQLQKIKNNWLSSSFKIEEGEGRVSSYMISVAENSYNFWTSTPNGRVSGSLAVPLWVGLDAVGALAGAGSSLWSQRNNQDTDWWEVGGQAVIWGAAGSIPGTRAFSKIFK